MDCPRREYRLKTVPHHLVYVTVTVPKKGSLDYLTRAMTDVLRLRANLTNALFTLVDSFSLVLPIVPEFAQPPFEFLRLHSPETEHLRSLYCQHCLYGAEVLESRCSSETTLSF